uniref:(northern house mosquito) hypothetical protein n=1 Tax=Culex pipiens TaxID=7175 RepID=A0A8D8ABU1_CULPI
MLAENKKRDLCSRSRSGSRIGIGFSIYLRVLLVPVNVLSLGVINRVQTVIHRRGSFLIARVQLGVPLGRFRRGRFLLVLVVGVLLRGLIGIGAPITVASFERLFRGRGHLVSAILLAGFLSVGGLDVDHAHLKHRSAKVGLLGVVRVVDDHLVAVDDLHGRGRVGLSTLHVRRVHVGNINREQSRSRGDKVTTAVERIPRAGKPITYPLDYIVKVRRKLPRKRIDGREKDRTLAAGVGKIVRVQHAVEAFKARRVPVDVRGSLMFQRDHDELGIA